MDKVRLGRALGYGTRHAAKTISAVVQAAASPDPRAETQRRPPTPEFQAQARRPAPPDTPRRAPGTAPQVARGVRHLGRSVWRPLALFSGVLWLRVTGLFFGLIAAAMAEGAWRLRAAPRTMAGSTEAHRFWIFAFFAALFGYFTVSSFVRASLKERRAVRMTR